MILQNRFLQKNSAKKSKKTRFFRTPKRAVFDRFGTVFDGFGMFWVQKTTQTCRTRAQGMVLFGFTDGSLMDLYQKDPKPIEPMSRVWSCLR